MVLVRARTGDPQGHTCCRDQERRQVRGSVSAALETRCLVSFHSPLQGWALRGWALRGWALEALRCSATKEEASVCAMR